MTVRSIEIDTETADLLEARAKARGMTVAEFLADVACNEDALPADLAQLRASGEGPWSAAVLEQDARRLAEFQRTRIGMPWPEIRAWMESWGTPDERPTPKPRRL